MGGVLFARPGVVEAILKVGVDGVALFRQTQFNDVEGWTRRWVLLGCGVGVGSNDNLACIT